MAPTSGVTTHLITHLIVKDLTIILHETESCQEWLQTVAFYFVNFELKRLSSSH